MVVTIASKFYSKLQLGISTYQEKTPADPRPIVIYFSIKALKGNFALIFKQLHTFEKNEKNYEQLFVRFPCLDLKNVSTTSYFLFYFLDRFYKLFMIQKYYCQWFKLWGIFRKPPQNYSQLLGAQMDLLPAWLAYLKQVHTLDYF